MRQPNALGQIVYPVWLEKSMSETISSDYGDLWHYCLLRKAMGSKGEVARACCPSTWEAQTVDCEFRVSLSHIEECIIRTLPS